MTWIVRANTIITYKPFRRLSISSSRKRIYIGVVLLLNQSNDTVCRSRPILSRMCRFCSRRLRLKRKQRTIREMMAIVRQFLLLMETTQQIPGNNTPRYPMRESRSHSKKCAIKRSFTVIYQTKTWECCHDRNLRESFEAVQRIAVAGYFLQLCKELSHPLLSSWIVKVQNACIYMRICYGKFYLLVVMWDVMLVVSKIWWSAGAVP